MRSMAREPRPGRKALRDKIGDEAGTFFHIASHRVHIKDPKLGRSIH
jgi:hypothetical protein